MTILYPTPNDTYMTNGMTLYEALRGSISRLSGQSMR